MPRASIAIFSILVLLLKLSNSTATQIKSTYCSPLSSSYPCLEENFCCSRTQNAIVSRRTCSSRRVLRKRCNARNSLSVLNKPSQSYLITFLLICGDVEGNPGPNFKYPCGKCANPVKRNQQGIQCDKCDQWFHRKCESLSLTMYKSMADSNEEWFCGHCCLPDFSDSLFCHEYSNDLPVHSDFEVAGDIPSFDKITRIHSNSLIFCHLNVRSLSRCFDEVHDLITSSRHNSLFYQSLRHGLMMIFRMVCFPYLVTTFSVKTGIVMEVELLSTALTVSDVKGG